MGKLTEYLKGGKLPTKRLPKTTLDQFALKVGLLYFVREKTDGSLHYSLIVPRSLINSAMQHAPFGQKKKKIEKAEELIVACLTPLYFLFLGGRPTGRMLHGQRLMYVNM